MTRQTLYHNLRALRVLRGSKFNAAPLFLHHTPSMKKLISLLANKDGMPLEAWYAEPLNADEAKALLRDVQRLQQQAIHNSCDIFAHEILIMIAHYFLDKPIEPVFENLGVICSGDNRKQALLELVYGQLLMSNKLYGSLQHLQKGFLLAAEFLGHEEYFDVMKRHELLGCLLLSSQPSLAQDLDTLLKEAVVIRELNKSSGTPSKWLPDRKDIIG